MAVARWREAQRAPAAHEVRSSYKTARPEPRTPIGIEPMPLTKRAAGGDPGGLRSFSPPELRSPPIAGPHLSRLMDPPVSAAWAAARRAMGTRKGEQET